LLGLFFEPEDGSDVPLKLRLTFNGLHGIISKKIVLFITTAVRTLNPSRGFIIYTVFQILGLSDQEGRGTQVM
jgi:hypothetical protein